MLRVLPESGRKHTRSTGSIIFSVATHTLLIVGVVTATTSGSARPLTVTRPPVLPLVFVPPAVDHIAAKYSSPWRASRPLQRAAPADFPAATVLDFNITPPTLPPIDSRMEGVFDELGVWQSVGANSATGRETSAEGWTGIAAFADKAALARSDNPVPRYPEVLRHSRVHGSVRARFVIDVNGNVLPRSVTILLATHPLFEESVREILPRLRFLPAEAGHRPVAVLVEQTFEFSISP